MPLFDKGQKDHRHNERIMSQRAPSWEAVEAETSENVGQLKAAESFEVALGSRLRKGWGEVRARSFESKGSISFSGGRVAIRTSASRLLGASVDATLALRLADIYNVRVNGRLVQFELVNGPGELEPIILRARDKLEAASIAAALPSQMTPRYATENQERLRFLEQITTRTPHLWATWTIVAVTSLVFIVMAVRGAGFIAGKPALAIDYGSNFGPYTLNGQWWRLLTSVFIHFGLAHIVFNMIVLVQTGRIAERLFGNVRFMVLYLFAGLTGSLMSLLWQPGVNSAGASGAIFGVLGALLAYVVLYSDSIPRSVFLKHFRFTALFICYNLLWGFMHRGVDNGAHVGGLIGGFMLACVLAPPLDNSSSLGKQTAMTVGMAITVGIAALGGLMWALSTLTSRPDTQEDLQFAEVLHQVGMTEGKAVADLRALSHEPETAWGREEYVRSIRMAVLPEWYRLYVAIDHAQVSASSSQAVVKERLLRHYGDICKALQLTADMAANNQLHDPASKAEIKRLLDDAKRQLVALKK